MNRFSLLPGIDKNGHPGFFIQDTKQKLLPSEVFCFMEDFSKISFNFFNQNGKAFRLELGNTYFNDVVDLCCNVFLLPIPEANFANKTPEQVVAFKVFFYKRASKGFEVIKEREILFKAKASCLIRESKKTKNPWIEIFYEPTDIMLNHSTGKLFSKKSAEEMVHRLKKEGHINEKTKSKLLDQISKLENFPEMTKEEIGKERSKNN